MKNKAEELKGGLNALFGGTPEPKKKEEPAIAKAETLEDTIKDQRLVEAMRAKRMDGRGRPRKNTDERGKRTDGYSRTSLILKDEKVAKIKEIAFLETLTMKEIFEAALDMVIESYESKHGEVIPRPERYKGDVNKVFGK